jgi:hypothetical protein
MIPPQATATPRGSSPVRRRPKRPAPAPPAPWAPGMHGRRQRAVAENAGPETDQQGAQDEHPDRAGERRTDDQQERQGSRHRLPQMAMRNGSNPLAQNARGPREPGQAAPRQRGRQRRGGTHRRMPKISPPKGSSKTSSMLKAMVPKAHGNQAPPCARRPRVKRPPGLRQSPGPPAGARRRAGRANRFPAARPPRR